jgi:tetratricopeptide (TPR) repeat protein
MSASDTAGERRGTDPKPADELVSEVQAELQSRFRLAGRGSVGRVEEACELRPGYFRDQRRAGRERCDLRVLLQALDALKVDPAEFFAKVLGPAELVARFTADAAVLRRRLKHPPRILARERERGAAERGAPAELTDALGHELAALEDLRYGDPQRVMQRATALVTEVPVGHRPWVLGLYGSACRVAGRLKEAQMVLGRALDLAAELGDPRAEADLLQRASYVVGDLGQFESAFHFAERATLLFVELGDLTGVGKAMVDQGVWLGCLDRDANAHRAFLAALHFLPENGEPDVRRNRIACLMSLGNLARRRGDLEAAREHLEVARAAADGSTVGPAFLGKLVALQALIAEASGDLERAEEHFREAFEIYRPITLLDTAVTAVDLARVQLQRGRIDAASGTARTLLASIDPTDVEEQPPVSATVVEMVRYLAAGRELTAAALERLRSELERAKRSERPARPSGGTR